MGQALVAYVIIPLSTFILAGGQDWLASNFSVIGSQGWGRLAFLVWGLLVGGYFYRQLGVLGALLGGGDKIQLGRRLAIILFYLSLATPYLPQISPARAAIHVILALSATLLLFFVVLALVLNFYRTNPGGGRGYLLAMALIGATTALLLAAAGMISTALEMFLIFSNLILIQNLKNRVKH